MLSNNDINMQIKLLSMHIKHLPLGDARWTKVAPSMEHWASQEILPVDDSMKGTTPHFQFISFS